MNSEKFHENVTSYPVTPHPFVGQELTFFFSCRRFDGAADDGLWYPDPEKTTLTKLYVMTYKDIQDLGEFLSDPSKTPEEEDRWVHGVGPPHVSAEDDSAQKKKPCVVFVGGSAHFNRVYAKPHGELSQGLGSDPQQGEYVHVSAVLALGPKKKAQAHNSQGN